MAKKAKKKRARNNYQLLREAPEELYRAVERALKRKARR